MTIVTTRPPVDPDDMLGLQRLEDERNTAEWLAKQRPPKPVDPELALWAEQLFPLDAILGQTLLLLEAASVERIRELGWDSVMATDVSRLPLQERLRQLRRDLRAVMVPCPIADIAPDEDAEPTAGGSGG
jgi:hypothetical protein